MKEIEEISKRKKSARNSERLQVLRAELASITREHIHEQMEAAHTIEDPRDQRVYATRLMTRRHKLGAPGTRDSDGTFEGKPRHSRYALFRYNRDTTDQDILDWRNKKPGPNGKPKWEENPVEFYANKRLSSITHSVKEEDPLVTFACVVRAKEDHGGWMEDDKHRGKKKEAGNKEEDRLYGRAIDDETPFIAAAREGAPNAVSWYVYEMYYMVSKYFVTASRYTIPEDDNDMETQLNLFLARTCSLVCFVDWFGDFFVQLVKSVHGLEVCHLRNSKSPERDRWFLTIQRGLMDVKNHLDWFIPLVNRLVDNRHIDFPTFVNGFVRENVGIIVKRSMCEMITNVVQNRYYIDGMYRALTDMCTQLGLQESYQLPYGGDVTRDHIKGRHGKFIRTEGGGGITALFHATQTDAYIADSIVDWVNHTKRWKEYAMHTRQKDDGRAKILLGQARQFLCMHRERVPLGPVLIDASPCIHHAGLAPRGRRATRGHGQLGGVHRRAHRRDQGKRRRGCQYQGPLGQWEAGL